MPTRRGTPERFLTTVVMTDVVGSTEHAAELGDHGWRELLELHHALVRAALRRAGGREIDTAGDGFFVTFDAPAAAVAFAVDIERGVADLGLATRAGVHVGEVEQMGHKVTGLTVVIASRIMAAAAPGEVLVSSTVRDLTTGSSLAFADRGSRELKGVPGEWHVYAVERTEAVADETGTAATARERRAIAVRRAAARPIWQRRPRLIGAMVLGLAAILATGGLLVAKPWQMPALASVSENSIGIIDPERNEVIVQIPVGTRPGGIAVGGGSAWVTNTGADTVSQIDLANRSGAVRIIDVGKAPKGIVVTDGSVWVANSGERTVSRINIPTGKVVQTIEVGNSPTAVAVAGDGLWVANATDSTIVRIDSAAGKVGQAVGVAAKPVALAADATGLWVASEDGAAVSHHDPLTGATLEAPIRLNARPTALAIDPTSVWVAAADGKVTRIDRAGRGVTATIPVGGSLATIAVIGDAIWVGDLDGNVNRLDAANGSAPPKRIPTSSAVASLAVVDGGIWLAAQASAQSHSGGTLRIVQADPDRLRRYDTDPLAGPFYNVISLEADGLLGYRRVGGSAGSVLLPDLAASAPLISDGGRTYTFRLRPGLEYSTGVPVRAADFRRALERSFQVLGYFGTNFGATLYGSVDGATRCTTEDFSPVDACDLSSGIVTDDSTGTVTFHLSEPDPDFAYRLAHAVAYPVPEGVPMHEMLDGEPFPGTGPYTVTATTESEVRLGRNPRFRAWDSAVRPHAFPDEIVFSVVGDKTQPAEMVESNEADYTSSISDASPELQARIQTQHPDRIHAGASITTWLELNTSIPPFDNIDARKAVNFAIDRGRTGDLLGPGAGVSCQILPPGFPGYQPYCPYTVRPDAGGQWTAPDMQAAQRHIDASGTRGQRVTLGPTVGGVTERFEYVGKILQELGYEVTLDRRNTHEFPDGTDWFDVTRTQAMLGGWVPDYLAPANFLSVLKCDGGSLNDYCDDEFNAMFDHALQLQLADPAAALAEWATLDHRAVDLALLVPLNNPSGVYVSERVGNYQFHPAYGSLFDQMWVQ
ncbi:MAG: ABC transporter substrate-binding protein [Chloroflexota bacterium]